MSVQTAASPADLLQRAAELLSKNWILALPTALVSLVLCLLFILGALSVVTASFLGHLAAGHIGALAGLGLGGLTLALLVAAGVALLFFAQAVVIHAAEDAWEGRPVDLSASMRVAVGRLPDLIVAFFLVGLILIVPIALSFFLLGIPLLVVAGYFLMYVTPAVVLGGESGGAALRTSYRLASQNVRPSLIGFAGIVGASLLGSVATSWSSHLPLINFVVSFVVGGLTAAYSALVAARFYDLLRGASPFSAGAPLATPPGAGPPTVIR